MPINLDEKFKHYPRLSLAEYPTPLEEMPRLSQEYGRPLYVKRDDLIGPGMGGNKTRKLEYLMADAQRVGARKVVSFGGLQSNHVRLTAAVACKLGMEPHLFFFEPRPGEMRGNLLLDRLMGAHLHFIPVGGGGGMSLEATIRLVHLVAWALVGPHYFIPVGGHNWLGGIGYAHAAMELDQQVHSLGIENARLVVTAGSGGTLAGLMAGLALCGSSIRLVGIDVGKLWKGFPPSIARLATEICTHLGKPHPFSPAGVPLIEDTYVGQGYAVPSEAGMRAIRLAARKEGLLLDPVYTGKSFAGMLDLIERGALGKEEPVIFLHTGGMPALFAFDNLHIKGGSAAGFR